MSASIPIQRAQRVLNDIEGVRWNDDEMIGWADEASRMVLKYVPSAGSRNVIHGLEIGKTRQRYPNAYMVIDVIRNTDGQGNADGPAIIYTTREMMDACVNEWHTQEGRDIQHWMYDPDHNREEFWVFPAPREAAHVEMVVTLNPAILSTQSDTQLSQDWAEAMTNWILFRCLSKQADYGGNKQTAVSYLNAFYTSVGQNDLVLRRYDPDVDLEEASRG